PVSLEKLPWAGFAVAKYYRPLSSDCAVARDLFDRIVNVPCHPGMAEVADGEICRFLKTLGSDS
ncbi:MAG: hypothetical protein GY798_17430, partial [Hyphomicrobiales bacterium]|nr:hypothetical protein [Hyphomicrobiales bacterium]